MQINRDFDPGVYSIRAYRDDAITVIPPLTGPAALVPHGGPVDIQASFVMLPTRLIQGWEPCRLEDLCAVHLEGLRELSPEVLLLGTGKTLRFPAPQVTRGLLEYGIGVEVMDNAAACRTYNFLVAEGRKVAVAILLGKAPV
jgi:uncharacterized protein